MVTKVLLVLVGIFTVVCAATDQKFFFDSYKAKPFIKLFGREGARIFYMIIGALIIIGGLAA